MSEALLLRIALALERMAPQRAEVPDWQAAGYIWRLDPPRLDAVERIARVPLANLIGIDLARDVLLANTRQFAQGAAANSALLWGARGMGKSSLVKSVHATVNAEVKGQRPLVLIEIAREDLASIADLLTMLSRETGRRFILFCDDLSFDYDDSAYKSLKAVLDGGIAGRPDNMIFYATSNRRHLMPRDMIENERQKGIHPSEAVEEKISLSDRFGLWLGFHPCDQDAYLAMIAGYFAAAGLVLVENEWRGAALEWSTTRGARSGRVAWQFVQDFAGKRGMALSV